MKVNTTEVKNENVSLLVDARNALFLLTGLKVEDQKKLFTIGNRVFKESIHNEIANNDEVAKLINAINALEGNATDINKNVQLTSTLVS
jgi:hypothetical protein